MDELITPLTPPQIHNTTTNTVTNTGAVDASTNTEGVTKLAVASISTDAVATTEVGTDASISTDTVATTEVGTDASIGTDAVATTEVGTETSYAEGQNLSEFEEYVIASKRDKDDKIVLPEHIAHLTNGDNSLHITMLELFITLRVAFSDKAANFATEKQQLLKWREELKPLYGRFSNGIRVIYDNHGVLVIDKAAQAKLTQIISNGLDMLSQCNTSRRMVAVPGKIDYKQFITTFGTIVSKLEPELNNIVQNGVQNHIKTLRAPILTLAQSISKINQHTSFTRAIWEPIHAIFKELFNIIRACINIFRHTPTLAERNQDMIRRLLDTESAITECTSAIAEYNTACNNYEERKNQKNTPQNNDAHKTMPSNPEDKRIRCMNKITELQGKLRDVQHDRPSVLGSVFGTVYATVCCLGRICINMKDCYKGDKPLTQENVKKLEKALEAAGKQLCEIAQAIKSEEAAQDVVPGALHRLHAISSEASNKVVGGGKR